MPNSRLSVQRRLIAELPVWRNVHMRFSSHAKVRRENEQVSMRIADSLRQTGAEAEVCLPASISQPEAAGKDAHA